MKKVRAKFPSKILSADVMAVEETRQRAGQDGLLPYLDIIMPMAYSYADNGSNNGSSTVAGWVADLRRQYPSKILLPILRGYEEGITIPPSKGLVSDLSADLAAVKLVKIDGYALFTYELLLNENSVTKKLSELKGRIGY